MNYFAFLKFQKTENFSVFIILSSCCNWFMSEMLAQLLQRLPLKNLLVNLVALIM